MIDNNLTWLYYVNSLSKTLSRKVHQLCRVKHFLNLHARKVFLHAHIISVIRYGSTLFNSVSENALTPLFSVCKRAVKAVILKSTSVVSLDYTDLNILPIKKLFASNKAILMQKSWLEMPHRPFRLNFNLLLVKPTNYTFLFLELTFPAVCYGTHYLQH